MFRGCCWSIRPGAVGRATEVVLHLAGRVCWCSRERVGTRMDHGWSGELERLPTVRGQAAAPTLRAFKATERPPGANGSMQGSPSSLNVAPHVRSSRLISLVPWPVLVVQNTPAVSVASGAPGPNRAFGNHPREVELIAGLFWPETLATGFGRPCFCR